MQMEEHQVKIPGTQMAMVALEHGIQCTWVSHYAVRAVARVLRLPARYYPTNLLVLGYPRGENPTASGKPRKRDLQDIVFYNTGETLPPADQVPHWTWD
jgi:nitroreductase